MKISEHISYREATFSAIAIRKGLFNTPNDEQLLNMELLADAIFEPLRLGLGGNPININSFFRRAELNSLIGGSKNSQHLCNNGAAMDLDSDNNKEIFDYIHDNLVFDQLIWEYGDNDNPAWVHVSYHKDNNRQQSLRCVNGNYYST